MTNIIISSFRDGLASLCFSKIKDDLNSGKQVTLVVPAQSTMSIEKEAFELLDAKGFFNLNIIRGHKLLESVLSETTRPGRTSIDSLGRSLLLRRIFSQSLDKLSNFNKIADDPSFQGLVGNFISQFKKNGLDSSVIGDIIAKNPSPILKNKLEDAKVFYDEYEKLLLGKFTDSDDLVSFAAEKASESKTIKESVIYYYGFYSFTNKEIELLAALEKASLGLNIALLTGSENYFAVTRDTLRKLKKTFPDAKEIKEEKTLIANPLPSDAVKIIRCANPYSQALTIAADIKKHVREDGISYQDITVLTGASEEMASTLKRVFKECQIPFFADETRSVLHSAALEALRSALDLVCGDFKTNDALRFVKSGVLDFEQDDIERFENYLKLYHIKSDKFAKPFKYGKEKLGEEVFAKLEEMRKIFYASTSTFKEELEKAGSVKEKSLCLYTYLVDKLDLPERLECLAISQEESGLIDASEESRQLWDSLVNLLDQMVELLGEEPISTEEYAKLLTSSLADIKIGVLPQSEGKVSLGTVARSQVEKTGLLYLAGVNDSIIPSNAEPNGLFTQNEIAAMEKLGFSLAKNQDALLEEENFNLYKSIYAAKKGLILCHCLADSNGASLKPSTLLADIKKLYPNAIETDDIFNQGNDLAFIEGKTLSLQKLSSALRDAMEGEEISPLLKKTYNLVKDDTSSIKEGLRYSNIKKPLGKEIAGKLFSGAKGFSFSPSRLDNFASCPFKHFVHYGLVPKEEQEFGMNAAEIGSVHHEALLALCVELSKAAKEGGFAITDPASTWMNVTDKELSEMLDKILLELESKPDLDGVMTSSKENEYTSKRTKSTCLKFAKHMVEEVRHNVIEEMYFEANFGRNSFFPPIEIETSAGKVYVEGRIDRVDVCPNDETKYVRVIDYKSGNTKFNKDLVSMGLQLQLMVYLESAIEKYPKGSRGAVYYYHIKDVPGNATLEDFPKDEVSESVLKSIEKEYRLDGMEVEAQFKEDFSSMLKELCAKITSGNIDIAPKKYKTLYNSCTYCSYSSICNKEI